MKERLQFEQRGIISSKKLNLDDKYFHARHTKKSLSDVTFSKTWPGHQHAKLASTLGLTQCDPPPFKILATPLLLNLNMVLGNSAQKLKDASLTFDKVNELE